jgi:hypothetical protein
MIRSREKVPDGFTIRSPWRRIFNGGRALDILRSFEGLIGDKAYIEVLQRFIQIFYLHLVPERNAWCRLDKHGDIEEESFALSEFQERADKRQSAADVTQADSLLRRWAG